MKRLGRQFTLIELLVVVTILATLAGAILVSYDGLEEKAAQGQAAHTLGTLDSTLRTFKVLNKSFPDEFDSLLVADTTGTETLSASVSNTTATPLVSMPPKLQGKLSPHQLTAGGLAALNAAGITELRYIGSTLVAGGVTGNAEAGAIPTRAFDNTGRGRGIGRTLIVGDHVAIVEGHDALPFVGPGSGDSSRLRDIGGLPEDRAHVVVAVGIGNNSTLIDKTGDRTGGLSEAPTYSNLPKDQYGRYIALFYLGSSESTTLIADVDYLSEAKLLAVIDTKGDWLDEEIAEFTGQKN
jgi:prepilin-type N-terminal cleavage/methylation domain-containing protein